MGQDENDDDREEEQPNADEMEPQTRAAFNLLRSSYNSDADFVRELFQDPLLQQKIRLVCYDLQDMHQEYIRDLEVLTQEESLHACAGRATHAWFGTVQAMLRRLHGDGLVTELNLLPRPRRLTQPMDPEDPSVQNDITLVELRMNFLVDLITNRCWSQAFYGLCFPYMVASVYCETESDRVRGCNLMRNVCDCILKLEDYVSCKHLPLLYLHPSKRTNPSSRVRSLLLEELATGVGMMMT